MLSLEASASGVKLGRSQGGIVDDEDVRVVQQRDLGGQSGPVVVAQPAGTDSLLVDSAKRGEHPHGELLGRHFHAEHDDGQLVPNRCLFDDVHRERGLSHGGAPCDDDQVSALQAGRHPVEIAESGRDARNRVFLSGQLVDALHHIGEHVPDGHRFTPARAAPFRNLEDAPFRFVEQFESSAPLRAKRRFRDFGAGPDQLPKYRTLADNFRVGDDVCGTGGVFGELREIGESSRGLELTVALEPLRHGDGVARPPFVAKARDRIEHDPMVVAVEMRRGEDTGDSVPGSVVDEDAAENRLLGFDRVRRDPKRQPTGLRRYVIEQWIGHWSGDRPGALTGRPAPAPPST